MKKISWILLLSVLVAGPIYVLSAGDAGQWRGVVVKVIDGDSLVVHHGYDTVEVRLYGVDAPEYRQSYGRSAREALNGWAWRQQVRVKTIEMDQYGRTVGIVHLIENDRNLNQAMIEEGHAWWYRRHAPEYAALEKAEAGARKNHLGLWGRDDDPAPPWKWRKKHR